MTEEATPAKRPVGRPRKNLESKAPDKQQPKNQYKMRAKPNWETVDPFSETSPDKLHIPPGLLPDGLSFQWVTDSALGQPEPRHRGEFEKGGWTPVHQEDFEGALNGMFMKKDDPGEINVGGLVLMARPKELTEKATKVEKRRAFEQVAIKEQALRGGDLPVSLDAQHKTALGYNRINKSVERIEIPDK